MVTVEWSKGGQCLELAPQTPPPAMTLKQGHRLAETQWVPGLLGFPGLGLAARWCAVWVEEENLDT